MRISLGVFAAVLLAGHLVVPAGAVGTNIGWATQLVAGGGTAANVLHAPDGLAANTFALVRNFSEGVNYPRFARFLGVTNQELARADIIAFELNGGSPASGGGWESSTWFFTDGAHAYAETFDEIAAAGTITTGRRAKFQTGDMLTDAFNVYFGVSLPSGQHVSWLLINVPNDINVHSPNFHVFVSGADTSAADEGTPDPESIGVLE